MSCRKRCWGLSCLFNPDVVFSEVVGKIFKTSLVDLAKDGYLRSFLKRFTGSMRLISTDRMFLVPLIHRTIPMLLPMYAGMINHDLLYMYIYSHSNMCCVCMTSLCHDIYVRCVTWFQHVLVISWHFLKTPRCPPQGVHPVFHHLKRAPEAVVKRKQLQPQWQQQGWVGQHEWRQRCQMYPDGRCDTVRVICLKDKIMEKLKKNLPNGTQPNDRLQGVNVCCLNWELLDVTGTLPLEKPLPPLCRTGVAQRLPPYRNRATCERPCPRGSTKSSERYEKSQFWVFSGSLISWVCLRKVILLQFFRFAHVCHCAFSVTFEVEFWEISSWTPLPWFWICSPPVRWGLLDFMSDSSPPPSPPSSPSSPSPPSSSSSCPSSSSSINWDSLRSVWRAGPQWQLGSSQFSVACWSPIATGILSVQCGVLDPNRDLMSLVWRAGPQPRSYEFGVACWTPTAILQVQCGVLDPNRDSASSVWRAGPQPRYCVLSVACWTSSIVSENLSEIMAEDMSERMTEDMSDRMSEDMSEEMSKGYVRRYVRKNVKRYVRRYVRRNVKKICQKECQKICQKECQKICQEECQKISQK